jgi:hypothetical protein
MTGSELIATSSGVASFASYYPDCRSVFGFCDLLTDVTTYATQLMYVVTGWFDNPVNDPLNGGKDQAAIQQAFDWTFGGHDALPTYTLYSGSVQGIVWNPGTQYVQPGSPINAQAALGNSPAEAMSAYFRYQNRPTIPFFEQLLNAFQFGLLHGLAEDQAVILISRSKINFALRLRRARSPR